MCACVYKCVCECIHLCECVRVCAGLQTQATSLPASRARAFQPRTGLRGQLQCEFLYKTAPKWPCDPWTKAEPQQATPQPTSDSTLKTWELDCGSRKKTYRFPTWVPSWGLGPAEGTCLLTGRQQTPTRDTAPVARSRRGSPCSHSTASTLSSTPVSGMEPLGVARLTVAHVYNTGNSSV